MLVALIGMTGTVHGATPVDTTAIQEAVEVGDLAGTSGIREHLRALQEIADEPGANGTRSTGSQGHEDSVTYVMDNLDANYWDVSTQPFTANVFTELAPAVLAATPAADPAWVVNQDFSTMAYSGAGSADERRSRSSISSNPPRRRVRQVPAARTRTSRPVRPALPA